jgi:indole-3-glycerol phosphate synthase
LTTPEGRWEALVDEIIREKAHRQEKIRGVNKDRPRSLAESIRTVGERGITPIIGEIKPSSPSMGVLREDIDVVSIVSEMEKADVAGISVLTEGRFFGGSLGMLAGATSLARVPVLRKDFLVDVGEIDEARRLGADAVLLIVRLLGDRLPTMYSRAVDLGLTPLVEVHDAGELEAAIELDPEVIGINNRNLSDLSIDLGTTARLSQRVPDGVLVVSESGFESREDVEMVAPHCDAFLVGSALMRGNPGRVIRELQGRPLH